jgi:GLPGLI family protein
MQVVLHQMILYSKNKTMKKVLYITLFVSLMATNVQAQNIRFFDSGVVTFEKKTNTHALLKKQANQTDDAFNQNMLDQLLKNMPQFTVENFTLHFSNGVTKFQFYDDGKSVPNSMMMIANSKDNVTYNNLNTGQFISQRNLFGDGLLIEDESFKIKWKITEEMREIAGYTCRRANGLLMDSIYVVAFFTDQITVPVGPEVSGGLPGMILGLAMPYEHITYFATKVEDRGVADKDLTPPTKGKKTTRAELEGMVTKSFGRNVKPEQINQILKSLFL